LPLSLKKGIYRNPFKVRGLWGLWRSDGFLVPFLWQGPYSKAGVSPIAPYQYSPFITLYLACIAGIATLGFYAWRRREVQGAVPFILFAAVLVLWVLAHGFKLIATDEGAKIFWFKFRAVLLVPALTAKLWFVLEYAGLGRWLTRRTLVLLSVVPLIFVVLVLTNGRHHLLWTRIWWIKGYEYAEYGAVTWWVVAYGLMLSVLHLMALGWLFSQSSRHRMIAAALTATLLIVGTSYAMRLMNLNPFAPLDLEVLALTLGALFLALGFFRFHIFDVAVVARDTVIELMPEGLMVLDAGGRVTDLNKAAEDLLGVAWSEVSGSPVAEVLHAYPKLLEIARDGGAAHEEISVGNTNGTRWAQVTFAPLVDRRGFHLGQLILLRDITTQRRIMEKLLDQHWTLATLKERESLAREFHDGMGQMLASAHLHTSSASAFLLRGETRMVADCLSNIADSVQKARESIRTYLLGVKSSCAGEQGIMPTLRQYLNHFRQDYGIIVELIVPPELEEKRIGVAVETQLQPIIQEALTNVRKHGGVNSARVIFASSNGYVQVTIEDDGRGFNPTEPPGEQGFGIRSMQGRTEAIGGVFDLSSAPGKGTRVSVRVPWRKEYH